MRWFQNVPALLLALSTSLVCSSVADDPVLSVIVYTGVAPDTLVRAEVDGSRILERAGVRLEWRNCRSDDPCPIPVSLVHVSVRIVNYTGRDGLGCSSVTRAGGTDAVVGFENVQRLAAVSGMPASQILAGVLAHEIGHLMLGPLHTGSGLMHGNWDVHDLERLGQRQLKFDPGQSTRIQAAVLARCRPRAPEDRSLVAFAPHRH